MKQLVRQAAAFSSVGVLNSLLGLGVIWLAMMLGMSPTVANVLGYVVGLFVSYLLHRRFTFHGAERSLFQVLRFCAAVAICWGCNITVLLLGIHELGVSPYLMQVAGMVTYSVVFFLLCRAWVFKSISS